MDNQGVRSQVKGDWDMAAARHKGSTNLLFLDYHVASHIADTDSAGWLDKGPFVWDPHADK